MSPSLTPAWDVLTRGNKLVVGTQLGMLSLWSPSRGMLDHVDRIPGHPASVDTLCTLDRDTILTGSSDGLVRVVQILPHKLLGIVADHGGMPVERIVRKGSWLASIGHGPEVKLTDVSELLEPGSEDEEGEDDDDRDASEDDDEDEERDDGGGMRGVGMGLAESPLSRVAKAEEDEEDEEEDEEEEDEEEGSESDGEETRSSSKRSKVEVVPKRRGGNDFFDDL